MKHSYIPIGISYNKINPPIIRTAPSIIRNPEDDTGSVTISDATAKKTKVFLVFPFVFLSFTMIKIPEINRYKPTSKTNIGIKIISTCFYVL